MDGADGSAACSSSRAARVHIELPKIFRPQVLQIFLELVGRHLLRWLGDGLRRGLAFLEEQRGQQALLRVDRRLESQRDGDAVRRTGVDVHRARGPGDVKLRVKGAVLHLGDVDASKRAAQPDDEILAEIVSEWPLAFELVHLDHDGFGLRLTDPDRQQPRAALLLQDHDVGVGRAIEPKAHHFDFDELHQIKLTSGPESIKAGPVAVASFIYRTGVTLARFDRFPELGGAIQTLPRKESSLPVLLWRAAEVTVR